MEYEVKCKNCLECIEFDRVRDDEPSNYGCYREGIYIDPEAETLPCAGYGFLPTEESVKKAGITKEDASLQMREKYMRNV